MAERVKDEQHQQRIAPATGPSNEPIRADSYGIGVRIDPAHVPPSQLTPKDVRWQELDHFVPSQASAPAIVPESLNSAHVDIFDDLNQSFRRAQAQHAARQADLIQREQTLKIQQSTFIEERNRITQQLTGEQSQLESRKSQFQKNEAAFHDRVVAFEVQSHKFDADCELLRHQQAELERQKKSARADILTDLKTERDELERAKSEFQKDLNHVHVLKEALDARLAALAEENAHTLKSEREKLWLSLSLEWEQKNQAFQHEQVEWAKVRDLEKSNIDRETAMFESAVESANAEFLKARESLALELTAQRDRHAKQLDVEKLEWEQTRRAQEAQLALLVKSRQNEILASRAALALEFDDMRERHASSFVESREEWERTKCDERAELEALRDALDLEFIASREVHATKLRSEREEWELVLSHETALLEQRQTELIRDRTLIENRIRFQQDHLDKSRSDLEQAQNEYRRERQVERQRLEDASLLMVRRLRQIDLYRASIDAREKSLDREHEVFSKTRKAVSSTADLDRLNLQAERNAARSYRAREAHPSFRLPGWQGSRRPGRRSSAPSS